MSDYYPAVCVGYLLTAEEMDKLRAPVIRFDCECDGSATPGDDQYFCQYCGKPVFDGHEITDIHDDRYFDHDDFDELHGKFGIYCISHMSYPARGDGLAGKFYNEDSVGPFFAEMPEKAEIDAWLVELGLDMAGRDYGIWYWVERR